MRIAFFFIQRPVFAAVLALILLIAGAVSGLTLPVTQYPNITPPQISVKVDYAGATAEVLEKAVAVPIEEEVNGAPNMIYMSSRSSNDGSYVLSCTFEPGTDQDIAAAEVQNRVLQAQGDLPLAVIQNGVRVKKRSPTTLMIVTVYSPDKSRDALFLSNYAQIHVISPLSRVPGIGDFSQQGHTYAMRIWLRPDRMAGLKVTADDLVAAVEEQNTRIPAGQIGAPPAAPNTDYQYTVVANSEMTRPEEYEGMIIRQRQDGSILRMRDIGTAELAGQNYRTFARLNGTGASSIMLYQLPSANALDTEHGVVQTLERLKKDFPPGVDYAITMDSTDFVLESMKEVLFTFGIALGLVFLIVLLFLGTIRATLIPLLAVPVSLVGTLAAFAALGFSLNLLTLFGLVLAIGLVVDDAIIVVESVERHIHDGLSGFDAARKTMEEVGRAVIAIALVLSAVFVPVAFLGGITGRLYRQFALTIAVSILLSAFVALTLTPALCAAFLKAKKEGHGPMHWVTSRFNRGVEWATEKYHWLLSKVVRRWAIAAAVLLGVVAADYLLLRSIPTGFVPDEDQGYFYMVLSLPEGASLQRTDAVASQAEEVLRKVPGIRYLTTIGGYSYLTDTNQSNVASLVVTLDAWDERKAPGLSSQSVMKRAQLALRDIPSADVTPLLPAPLPGLGGAGGFTFQLEDTKGTTIAKLDDAARSVTEKARKTAELSDIFNSFTTNRPQVSIEVDRDKANTLGIPVDNIMRSLQIFLGGLIVNNFDRFGRVYKTMLQAEPEFRSDPEDIRNIFVRTREKHMLPLGNVVKLGASTGPDVIQRFNLYRSAEISGSPSEGYSSGQAIDSMERIGQALPEGMDFQWSGAALQESKSRGTQLPIFGLALAFVFLFLAAQYESWLIPISVMLSIPAAALGAYAAIWIRGLENNIYAQIGIVTLIGLATKDAILIVEFAHSRRDEDTVESALEAARLRFRPILMTSLAFILGMLPLVVASGAGSAGRHALGTAVLFGMVTATALGLFFTPTFYVAVRRLLDRKKKSRFDDEPARHKVAEDVEVAE